MDFWTIIYFSDLAFFIFVCMTVVYMGIFAMASMFSQHQNTPKSRVENRFIILIPAYKNGVSAEQTVRSILGQTYPQRQFDVTVIADQIDEMSNFRLAQEPITLLIPNFTKSSRAKSLQLAINNTQPWQHCRTRIPLSAKRCLRGCRHQGHPVSHALAESRYRISTSECYLRGNQQLYLPSRPRHIRSVCCCLQLSNGLRLQLV